MLGIRIKAIGLIIAGLVLPVLVFSQSSPGNSGDNENTGQIYSENTIPELLRQPMTGEAPRYPIDRIIGTLDQGTAPEMAWLYANKLMSALVSGNLNILETGESTLLEKSLESLEPINPGKYHIGGGRIEEDGTVSFLVRFLGRQQWIIGELYIQQEDDDFFLDDLVLEGERDLEEGKDGYPYDFSPYERFF